MNTSSTLSAASNHDWSNMALSSSPVTVPDSYEKHSKAQIPTPPDSQNNSPVRDLTALDADMYVSVSTTFYPGAQLDSLVPNETVLLTKDNVRFHVHAAVLSAASTNQFGGLIAFAPIPGAVIRVAESSTVLNVILHTVYDMSCTHYAPSIETLTAAVKRFHAYGLDVRTYVAPQCPLYLHLLSQAPLYPIQVYALASNLELEDLAVSTSSHLLSYELSSLTDELVDEIGPRYLKRLFFMHMGRADALKRLILPPPTPHPSTLRCGFEEQKSMSRAWGLGSAYLAWDARTDLSVSSIEAALDPLVDHLSCQLCKTSLRDHLRSLAAQWSMVKRTI